MHRAIRHLLTLFIHLHAFGPLLLGIFDSSFLFLPFGNDILVVLLTAREHNLLMLFVFTAAVGSTIGVFLLDLVSRKGGKEGLKRMMRPKRLAYLQKKMDDQAVLAIIVACLAPPPFPFTLVIAASSALQFPRPRLLAVVFVARAIRFTLVGLLAIWKGRQILRIAQSPGFEWFMAGFIVLCTIGSAIQVRRWFHR